MAVTNGHVEIASVLRQAMKTENRGTPEAPVYIDPVGENAPIDLTGNTPLGWASKESKGKHLKEFMPFESQSVVSMADVVSACPDASKSCRDLIAELHVTPVKIGEKTPTSTPSCAGIGVAESGSSLLRKGDKSILPQSPLVLRSGTSPLVQRSQASNSPMIRRERVISASTNILEDVLGTVAPEIADLPHGSQLWYGFSEATGWRPYMEDRIFVNVPILSVLTCLRLPPSIVHDRAKNIDFETPTKGAAHLPLPVPISSTIKHSIITDIEKLKRVNPCTVFGCNSTYQLLSESYLFGVCDGHGGDYAVNFLQKHIPATITNNYIEMYKLLVTLRCASTSPIVEEEISGLFCEMFKTACLSLDEKLSEQGRMLPQAGNKGPLYLDKSGSTGLFCLVNGEYISVGNVGDTRAVCGSSNERGGVEAVALSHDHKPNEAGERERIEAAGAG